MKPRLASTLILAAASLVVVLTDPAVDKGKKEDLRKLHHLLTAWNTSVFHGWAELTLGPTRSTADDASQICKCLHLDTPLKLLTVTVENEILEQRVGGSFWRTFSHTISICKCISQFETSPLLLFSDIRANRSLSLRGARTLWHLSDWLRCAHRGCRHCIKGGMQGRWDSVKTVTDKGNLYHLPLSCLYRAHQIRTIERNDTQWIELEVPCRISSR